MIKATDKNENPTIVVWNVQENLFYCMDKATTKYTITNENLWSQLNLSGLIASKSYNGKSLEDKRIKELKDKLEKALKIINS